MKSSFLILAALLLNAGIAQAAPRDRGAANHMSAPPVEIVTPPTESLVPPPVNPGARPSPAEFGTPPVNSGAIGPLITNQPSGALPGSPGSPTYDPNAALPSLDNPSSPLLR